MILQEALHGDFGPFLREKMMNKHQGDTSSILFIVPSDYTSLLEKGVASMILERDEGSFFKKVFTVHPYSSKTQTLELNETHQLIEFGPNYPFSFLNFNLGKFINYILKPLPMVKTLIHLIRRNHIDVIRATDPFWCGFYAWAASKMAGIPFCISIHADYDKCYQLRGKKRGTPSLFKILEKVVLPRANLVMPIRDYLVSSLLKKGVVPDRIRVIPHGVDVEDFLIPEAEDIYKRFNIPVGRKLLSFVGRLAKENYVYDLIGLAKRLSKVRNDFILLLVGDGLERKGLETLVNQCNLSSMVMFTGFQPRARVISIRRQSSLALCLMGGLSLIEACAAGIPTISYNIEWHYELVRTGETGFLVDEHDLDGLTEAATYLLDHPIEAKEMGENASKLARVRHNILRTSEVKKNCYREMLRLRVSNSKGQINRD